ncbi:ABC transporter permease [Kribbia dieselivorans]|uniref:ABC transporter permease n=1 Tax=Kribbia dieselivorans TaxID=331526 RepID=UPI0008389FFC|nr:ABC transporter permease [Kribbia dieselivorans]
MTSLLRRSGLGRLNASLVLGGTLVTLVALAALVSIVWTPYPPMRVLSGVGNFDPPSGSHWFGIGFRRDIFSQVIAGAQTTLLVGVVAVGLAALVGVPLGLVAAMGPRWLSELVMRTSDLVLAFPALLLAIMLAAIYGQGRVVAMVAIGIASIPTFARVTRSGSLAVLASDFVLAARAAGRGPLGIAVRHVLPNIAGLLIVQASVAFALAILAEAALAYLGLGTPPDTPSWGRMLLEATPVLHRAPHLAIFPGLAIAISVLGFNLLGDGLRDRLDPKLLERS